MRSEAGSRSASTYDTSSSTAEPMSATSATLSRSNSPSTAAPSPSVSSSAARSDASSGEPGWVTARMQSTSPADRQLARTPSNSAAAVVGSTSAVIAAGSGVGSGTGAPFDAADESV